jgi:hypothetical protein
VSDATQQEQASAVARAQRVVDAFKKKQKAWATALKRLAAAGASAAQVADVGFSALMDKYLEYRAGGNRELAPHERTVVGNGYIDLSRRWNIQLTGFTFGKYNKMSSTLQGHVGHKRLLDLADQTNPAKPGWQAQIHLRVVDSDAGPSTIKLVQGASGVSARSCAMAPDVADRVRSLGGEDKLWALLDSATLGTRVIWGTGA